MRSQRLAFVLGFVVLISVAISQPSKFEVNVGSRTVLSTVDRRFVSACIDAKAIVFQLDFSSAILQNLVRQFVGDVGAYLRLGGGTQQSIIYDLSNVFDRSEGSLRGDYVLKSKQWEEILGFTKATGIDFIFGLNSVYKDWLNNAENLISYTAQQGYHVAGYEVGNEPHDNGSSKAKSLAKQFSEINDLLKKYGLNTTMMIGPDLGYTSWHPLPTKNSQQGDFLQEFLTQTSSFLGALTLHLYPFDHSDVGVEEGNNNDPECTSVCNYTRLIRPQQYPEGNISQNYTTLAANFAKEYAPTTQLWVGETASVNHFGVSNVSDAFVSGFWYLDQLGWLAQTGYKVHMRQVIACINCSYGLLDQLRFEPNPDFYSSVLWKRTMGTKVLSTSIDNNGPYGYLRAYAHCTHNKTDGSVSMVFINTLNNTITIKVDGLQSTVPRNEYHLSSNNLQSLDTYLNGNLLRMSKNGDLPNLPPSVIKDDPLVTLAPLTYTFVVFSSANAPACSS